MCGIAGIINLSKKAKPIEHEDTLIMKKLISSRGSDSEGSWRSEDKNIILIIQRLATQDKRPIANQPCFSTDKNVIAVLNGEIYNHNEIRELLESKGYKFLTRNDTEVLANAYHYWGKNIFSKILGQFSFVIFDKNKKLVLIARDEHGICPLFYFNNGEKFYFSSTPESIHLQLKNDLKINKQALSDFMIAGAIPNGNTFFENIKYLKPGHFFEIKLTEKIETSKLFSSPTSFLTLSNKKSENEYIDQIFQIIEMNMKTLIKGDKNVGIYLSGGLDSALMLAFYKKIFPEKNIKTFTASFENMETKELVGEHKKAKEVCQFFNCHNETVNINSDMFIKSIGSYSQPSETLLPFIYQSLANKAKKSSVEVALSGEGADEMFLGYDHQLAAISQFKKDFSYLGNKYKFRGEYIKNIDFSKAKIEDLFLGGGGNIDLDNNRKSIFTEEILETFTFKNSIQNLINSFKLINPDDVEKIVVLLDLHLKVPELCLRRAEGASMGAGVEMRFPYLRKNLKNLLYTIPLDIKVGNESREKALLRKVAKKIIPEKIIHAKLPMQTPASRSEYYKNSGSVYKNPAFKTFFFKNHSIMKDEILSGKFLKLNLL